MCGRRSNKPAPLEPEFKRGGKQVLLLAVRGTRRAGAHATRLRLARQNKAAVVLALAE